MLKVLYLQSNGVQGKSEPARPFRLPRPTPRLIDATASLEPTIPTVPQSKRRVYSFKARYPSEAGNGVLQSFLLLDLDHEQ